MRPNEVMGIIFPNIHDELMGEMTSMRSMGSVPFAARYRIIDFSLSNLVNAGVSKIGIVTRGNYQSLMDHLGNGKPWDLDRKKGGIIFLPPYSFQDAPVYHGNVDALAGVMNFLKKSTEKYAVLCNANTVSNIDIEKMMDMHEDSGADITLTYKTGKPPANCSDTLLFSAKDGRLSDMRISKGETHDCDYSLGIMAIGRELLTELIEDAFRRGKTAIGRDILVPKNKLKIFGYKVEGFACVVDGVESYFNANFDLIRDSKARQHLFKGERPVYTKIYDDMPTKFGLFSHIEDSIIADGCVIEGSVKNCVIFRGARVERGAELENCIIMQDSVIGEGSVLRYVALDKSVKVSAGLDICGAPAFPVYVGKGKKI